MEKNEIAKRIFTSLKEELTKANIKECGSLDCLFNHLNGNKADFVYPRTYLKDYTSIVYPIHRADNDIDERTIIWNEAQLAFNEIQEPYSIKDINYLLDRLERLLIYLPSSEYNDVSLFDQMKINAAFASSSDISNGFLFLSIDMSGIQAFIYHLYDNADVLKNLRARSFFLELLVENAVDNLLDKLGLSRASVIYLGGGHAYLLLPKTEETATILKEFDEEMNSWLRDKFGADLFMAIGTTECTRNDLYNIPVGSYNRVFRDVSGTLSERKKRRYTPEQLIKLNSVNCDAGRECKICHNSSLTIVSRKGENICEMCEGLIDLSNGILKKTHYAIIKTEDEYDKASMPIYSKQAVMAIDENDLISLSNKRILIRSYSKNDISVGSKTIFIGDYKPADKNSIVDLIKDGIGIERVGVVRGDIDNLGQAFVRGFPDEKQNIFRATSFSRSMSLFFKYFINGILSRKSYSVSIVYSGGDDVFFLGDWKNVLDATIDINTELKKYSLGTLTISAGFGMYQEKYPIYYIADDTGEMEERSKHNEGKNSITLFEAALGGEYTFKWDTFITKVYGEKYRLLDGFLTSSEEVKGERGTAFLYNLLELIISSEEKLNIARLAYTLARLKPKENKDGRYKEFSQSIYNWTKDKEDRRQLITAIYLFIYKNRKREAKEE